MPKTRGPGRTPASLASTSSTASYGVLPGIAHGRDAEREPRAALCGAVVLLQMRMEFGQARHDRLRRGVDHFALR